jgi:hypothetical protein
MKNRNAILSLSVNGRSISKPSLVKMEIVRYYKDLFSLFFLDNSREYIKIMAKKRIA